MSPTLKDREIQRVKGQQSCRIQEEVPEVLSGIKKTFSNMKLLCMKIECIINWINKKKIL